MLSSFFLSVYYYDEKILDAYEILKILSLPIKHAEALGAATFSFVRDFSHDISLF